MTWTGDAGGARRRTADARPERRGPSERIGWVDAVRGTAIVLLLLWHAAAVPALLGVQMPEAIRIANDFFLPYRMPTLMLLSGMLLSRSLSKPLAQYYAGKFAMIIWPYVVWVLIAKATFLDVEGMPWWHWRAWYATSYLWFLFFIGVYYLVAPAFARLPPWAPIGLAVVLGAVIPQGTMEQRMAYFAIFFFAGAWISRRADRVLALARDRRLLAAVAVPTIALGVAASLWPDTVQYAVLAAPVSIAGTLALIGLFSRIDPDSRIRQALAFIGRSSIVYYVSHYPLMALLTQTGAITNVVVLALTNLLAALALGTAFALLKERVPVAWLFRAPGMWTRGLSRALSALPVMRRSAAAPANAAGMRQSRT